MPNVTYNVELLPKEKASFDSMVIEDKVYSLRDIASTWIPRIVISLPNPNQCKRCGQGIFGCDMCLTHLAMGKDHISPEIYLKIETILKSYHWRKSAVEVLDILERDSRSDAEGCAV